MVEISKAAGFLAKFFAIFLLLQALVLIAPLEPIETAIAGFEAGVLGLQNTGNLIVTGNGNFEIAASCTGLVSAAVLAAVVFSLRKPGMRKKLAVFGAGTLLLLGFNLVRVYFVLWSARFGIGTAELLHIASWYATSAVVIGAWFYLTKKIAGVKNFYELL